MNPPTVLVRVRVRGHVRVSNARRCTDRENNTLDRLVALTETRTCGRETMPTYVRLSSTRIDLPRARLVQNVYNVPYDISSVYLVQIERFA